MLYNDVGGAKSPWRIYDLQGTYLSWLPDTGAFNTGGAWGCGLEKLRIDTASGKFVALHDYDETIVDYFTKEADKLDKSEAKQVWKDCLKKFQEKQNWIETSDFELKVEGVEIDTDEVEPGCAWTQSKNCGISSWSIQCDNSNKQCGDGIIKCINNRCSNNSVEYSLMVVATIIIAAFIF